MTLVSLSDGAAQVNLTMFRNRRAHFIGPAAPGSPEMIYPLGRRKCMEDLVLLSMKQREGGQIEELIY
jgi:hypothetical protein